MSAAAAATEAPAKGGKKKLIVILAVVVLLAVVGAAAAMMLMKKKHAEDDGDDAEATEQVEHHASAKVDTKHPPTFVPLEPFTVNLADHESERYAQIGVTLEVDDAKTGETIKAFMPAIRNNVLMLLAHKTSTQLLSREGKERLAAEIRREASSPLGVEIELDDEEAASKDDGPKKKKKKKAQASPITAVQFSNFIIQ